MKYDPQWAIRNRDAALQYAAAGIPVFPLHHPVWLPDGDGVGCSCGRADCKNTGKHPRTRNGFKDATVEVSQIQSWWNMWPLANIGAATAGYVVVDVDPDHGGELEWKKLEREYGRVPTWTILTGEHQGTRGIHLWYRAPDGVDLRNTNGGDRALGQGIDTRASGGYVILPPSIHPSGVRYELKAGAPEEIAPLPGWILHRMQAPAEGSRESTIEHLRLVEQTDKIVAQGGVIPYGQRDTLIYGYCCGLRSRDVPLAEAITKVRAVWGLMEQPDGNTYEWAEAEEKLHRVYAQFDPGKSEEFRTRSGGIIRSLTDDGNALRLVDKHGDNLKWTPGIGQLAWDGTIWRPDALGQVQELARDVARGIYEEAADCKDEEQGAKVAAHGQKTKSARAIAAMIALAKSDPRIATDTSRFDADPYLLSVANGTVELKTGTLREHRRQDLITWRTSVQYDQDAECPRWREWLAWATGGDHEVQTFLQQAVGMTLTGDTAEHVFLFLYGPTRRGKSTFIEVLSGLLGPGATVIDSDLLVEKGKAQHPASIAELRGKRLATHNETEEGGAWAVNPVKELTSARALRGRQLYGNWFDFDRQFTLWIAGNHKPRAKGGDPAFFERMRLVPFRAPKPEEDKRVAGLSAVLLREEGPGILRWAVQGAVDWIEAGRLITPRTIREETAEYQAEEDVFGEFFDQTFTADPGGRVGYKTLEQLWEHFAGGYGGSRLNTRTLLKRMDEAAMSRGIKIKKSAGAVRMPNGVLDRALFGIKRRVTDEQIAITEGD